MKPWFALFICLVLLSCGSSQPKQPVADAKPGFNKETFQVKSPQAFYSWAEDRIPLVSAHRGGPYTGLPENAVATFAHIAEKTPAIIECDIAMTSDSVLVLMHDETLDRTTTGSGKVIDLNWADLQGLQLKDNEGTVTEHRIPTLKETLEWGQGKVLFTLDVKRGVPFSRVVDLVQETGSQWNAAIITYNAKAAQEVYMLDPTLMISVGLGNKEAYEAHKALGIPDKNMIAFVGVSEPDQAHYQFLHDKGITCILGVLGNLDKRAAMVGDDLYASFVRRGADILATDRPVEASEAIKSLVPETSSKREFFK